MKQEDSAFSWTREALIKIGFILECFALHFNQKEVTEVERNVEKLIISLMARRSINLQRETRKPCITLQNGRYLWTLDMNHHQPDIQCRDLTVPTLNLRTS